MDSLGLAEELQLKGLSGTKDEDSPKDKTDDNNEDNNEKNTVHNTEDNIKKKNLP